MRSTTVAFRKIQWVLAGVVCFFVLSSSYLSYVIIERQEALHQVAGYNETWSVSQTSSELLRLEKTLLAYSVPGSGVSLKDVRLRLDIMFNRLGVLENATFRNFVRNDNFNKVAIEQLKTALDTIDRSMPKSDTAPFDPQPALKILSDIEPDVIALGSAAIGSGAKKIDEDEAGLERLHLIYTGLTAGLILCGIALIILLVQHNRLLARARDKLNRATEELQRTSRETDAQNFRYLTAFNNMTQALCMFDKGGRMIVCNDRFSTMAARPRGIASGTSIDSIAKTSGSGSGSSTFEQLLALQVPLIKEARRGVFMHEASDRKAYVVTHEPLPEGGWLATYEDITERRRLDARIAHMAHHDALTNLANRVLFMEMLERKLKEAKRDGDAVAVCFLDLDGFKDVNDTMGHHVGDELLQRVSQRLLAHVGPRDVVARIGGDEFAVINILKANEDLSEEASEKESLELPIRLVAELTRPYLLDDHEVTIGASVGVAKFPQHSSDPEELLKYADLAMYEAKAEGKGRVRVFRPDMDERLLARKALEVDLRKALKRREMEVYYQPLVDTATRQVSGYEALLRWNHPRMGQIPPMDFIPIAEDTGLIGALGAWVLNQACADAVRWPDHITVAVNLSPIQFRNDNLIQTVVAALTDSGLEAGRLELEITESVLLDAGAHTASTLLALKKLGISIAMDDFGTGYSSLSNLRSFPFDKIKIDRSFIRELTLHSESLSVVRLITALAQTLGMSTTAEGVETEEQFAVLQEIGCTQVQGYLFAKPKPARDLGIDPRQ